MIDEASQTETSLNCRVSTYSALCDISSSDGGAGVSGRLR